MVLAIEFLTLQLPFSTAGWGMGCLTLKDVWRHMVRVLGVSPDEGSPAVGCPVMYPTTQGVLRYRVPPAWDVLRVCVLIQDTQCPAKRHFGLDFS